MWIPTGSEFRVAVKVRPSDFSIHINIHNGSHLIDSEHFRHFHAERIANRQLGVCNALLLRLVQRQILVPVMVHNGANDVRLKMYGGVPNPTNQY